MMIVALALLASLRFVSSASAGNTFIYDFFSPYLQRIDGITPGAGDAKEVNSVTHTIDPWPPYVTNRHIPGDGQRMTGAIERYRDVSKLPLAPQPIAPLIDAKSFSGGAGGGTSGGGSSAH
jgi:hypothetical protein